MDRFAQPTERNELSISFSIKEDEAILELSEDVQIPIAANARFELVEDDTGELYVSCIALEDHYTGRMAYLSETSKGFDLVLYWKLKTWFLKKRARAVEDHYAAAWWSAHLA